MHSRPPLYGPIADRIRVLVPPPHVLEHAPHVSQFPQVQSVAANANFYWFLELSIRVAHWLPQEQQQGV